MKILKRGVPPIYKPPTYKKKCPYCKSVLEYTESDKDYLGNVGKPLLNHATMMWFSLYK
jgi:hypothetical protein